MGRYRAAQVKFLIIIFSERNTSAFICLLNSLDRHRARDLRTLIADEMLIGMMHEFVLPIRADGRHFFLDFIDDS